MGRNSVSRFEFAGGMQLDANDVLKALQTRYSPPEWAFFKELRVGTGFKGYSLDREWGNPEQRIDAWVINCWPSQEFKRLAFEVKISRSDFLKELAEPTKRQVALKFSNEFYFAAPAGLIKSDELPEECGLIEVYEDGRTRIRRRAPTRPGSDPCWRFVAALARRTFDRDATALEEELRRYRSRARRSEEELWELKRQVSTLRVENRVLRDIVKTVAPEQFEELLGA